MQTLRTMALVASGLVALVACAPPAPPPAADTAADEAALSAGTKAWMSAYNAGDVAAIVALYAEDGIIMPPNAPAATGREAMQEYLAKDVAGAQAGGLKLAMGAESSGVSGTLGWHSGSYQVVNAAGEAVDSGSYLEAWRKANGKWLIVRDIWNSDRPAAAAEALVTPAP